MSKSVNNQWDEQNEKQVTSAKAELTQAKAIKVLLTNNDLAAEIHICGMVLGVCNNKLLIPVVDHQIKEIEKFIDGKANEWE